MRDALLSHEHAVRQQLVTEPSAVGIDQVSLGVFLENAGDVSTMHNFIVEHGGEVSDEPSAEFLSMLAQGLIIVGVATIHDLERAIASHLDAVMKFVLCTYHERSFKGVGFYPGAPLWHLCYVLAIERGGRRGLEEWFAQMHKEERFMSLDEYVACYEQAKTS